jgi:hypothetical protein
MGQSGTKRKIPEQHWPEIYQLYASGVSVPTIHVKIKDEWKVDVGERAVYQLIQELRIQKQKHLNEMMDADTDDDIKRLKWLQNQLEEVAVETRITDKLLFLKVADRLIRVYELKMTLRASDVGHKLTPTDNGRDELLKELAAKIMDKHDTNGAS